MNKRRRWRATEAAQRKARELRRRQTPAEQALWARLRGRQLLGLKVRRQHPIDCYIVDFFCARAKLVVEVDGGNSRLRRELLSNIGLRPILPHTWKSLDIP